MDEHCTTAKSLVEALEAAVDRLAGVQRRCGEDSNAPTAHRELAAARERFLEAQLAFAQHRHHCPRCQATMSSVE